MGLDFTGQTSQERIRRAIYEYKFYNVPLEEVILFLLKECQINQFSLRNPANKDIFFQMADQLTSFKFNKTDMNSAQFAIYIKYWLHDNQGKIKVGYL